MSETLNNIDTSLHKTLFGVRLILQSIAFVYKDIPPIIRITIIFLTDFIDGEIYRYKHKNAKLREDEVYQVYDKTNDIIGYIFTYLIIVSNKLFSKNDLLLITGALIYRIIGASIAYKMEDKTFFFIFFDIYKELIYLLYFIKESNKRFYIFMALLFLKLCIEYTFHVKNIF